MSSRSGGTPSPPSHPRRRVVITAAMRRSRHQTLRVWARKLVKARFHRLERALQRLETAANDETIHNVRVGSRRLRVALRHLRPCFPAHQVPRLRLEVRHVARLLGQVRDLDILAENLASDARRKASPLALLLKRLLSRRQRRLKRALPEAQKLRERLGWWHAHLKS